MERESILTPRRVVIREIAGRGDLLAGASSPNRASQCSVRRECRQHSRRGLGDQQTVTVQYQENNKNKENIGSLQ